MTAPDVQLNDHSLSNDHKDPGAVIQVSLSTASTFSDLGLVLTKTTTNEELPPIKAISCVEEVFLTKPPLHGRGRVHRNDALDLHYRYHRLVRHKKRYPHAVNLPSVVKAAVVFDNKDVAVFNSAVAEPVTDSGNEGGVSVAGDVITDQCATYVDQVDLWRRETGDDPPYVVRFGTQRCDFFLARVSVFGLKDDECEDSDEFESE